MHKTVLLLLVGIAIVPVGCTLAPTYTRPAAPVSSVWPTGAAYAETQAGPATTPAAGLGWREFITDEKLGRVIETALSGNRDLRLAALAVERARALYGVERDQLYPEVSATAAGSKQRTSIDLTSSGASRTSKQYSVDVGVFSWELDFFGRIRSLKDEALEDYLATAQGQRSAQVLLVAAVADAYLALAADREALALAESTLQAQQAAYNLVRRQYDNNIATELDLYRAQVPLETARRDIARYTQRVAQDRNGLDLLAGSPVPDELLPAGLGSVGLLTPIAPGLPSAVLYSRPDVLAAEHQLRGAHAFIGAARAAFFPRISLTSTLGTASTELSNLFASGRGTWSFGPDVEVPIFDARTWSAYRVSKVQREIAVAGYERAIQNAFREVADALAVRGTVDQQFAAQEALVKALSETHRLALARFEEGLDSYLGVLDAQRALFAGQQVLVALRLAQRTSLVQLYAALGGGWQSDTAAAIFP